MKKRIITTIIFTIIILIIILIIGSTLYYINMMNPVSNESEVVTINIQNGSTPDQIGSLLKKNNLIKNQFIFKVYVRLNKVSDMKAGEYELNKNMSVNQIVELLQEGPDTKKKTVNITFLEGKNMRWIASTIANKTNNTEENVYSTLEDNNYLQNIINKYWFLTEEILNSNIYYSLEGYLFPDTYNFKSTDVTVEEIFNTMLDQMETKLEQYKDEIQKSKISVHKLITTASIVELEAANPEDRAGVASVIYNRINSNMQIGSDVTTYYAIKVDMSERDLRQSELNKYNLYNTRGPNMEGKLPIGPICSVGIKSIEAALKPAKTDYLYFVADKNGKIYFAKNVQDHNNNISRLKSQGLWYIYE